MSNRRKRTAVKERPTAETPGTFWNGEPTPARRVEALVGEAPEFPQYWAATEGLIGQWIPAVEVTYGGQVFYLDDRNGSGWAKVTDGHGSPRYGHRNFTPTKVRPR